MAEAFTPDQQPVRPLFADVPTPFAASGAVDGSALDSYVRWLRLQSIAGVCLWGDIGSGSNLSLPEREELYTVWRAGLFPHQKILIWLPRLPASGSAAMQIQTAQHARELGADGILATAAHAIQNPADSAMPAFLPDPACDYLLQHQCDFSAQESDTPAVEISRPAALGIRLVKSSENYRTLLKLISAAGNDQLAGALLLTLAKKGIISTTSGKCADEVSALATLLLALSHN